MRIDPIRLALKRRASVYKEGKLLLSNFEGTEQQKDLNKTKGHVKGAQEDFYRVKTNVKDEAMQEELLESDIYFTIEREWGSSEFLDLINLLGLENIDY